MDITLVSVTRANKTGAIVARARVVASGAGARVWIELRFEPEHRNAWEEAYDRILELLDLA